MKKSITCAALLAISFGFSASAFGIEADEYYDASCAICHGTDGKGDIPGTPDFTKNNGPLSKSDAELHANIKNGFQSPSSSMAMPAKGGNPNLTDADIAALVEYMKLAFGAK